MPVVSDGVYTFLPALVEHVSGVTFVSEHSAKPSYSFAKSV